MGVRTIVIVGAGVAGAHAAATLREGGFDGRVVVVGDEPERPYERPPLSKGYLRGTEPRDRVFVHGPDWAPGHDVELRTGTPVARIDPASRAVILGHGDVLTYDRLLLAPGAEPRRLAVPGGDLDGVTTLRTLADADRLREALATAARAIVIGGGWLGCEVAASARVLGVDVVLIVRDRVPLQHLVGEAIGDVIARIHADHGVDLVTRAKVASLRGGAHVEEAVLDDGRRVEGDLVVVAIGADARTTLAAETGLAVRGGGIATDERLHTSGNFVFAAGDAAAAWHPVLQTRLRVGHWANARHQGRVAARNLLGASEAYDRIPYAFSDQYGLAIEHAGHAPRWDRVVVRGRPGEGACAAFWLTGERVTAGLGMNAPGVIEAVQGLVRSGRAVDDDRLADPDTPLEDLAAAA